MLRLGFDTLLNSPANHTDGYLRGIVVERRARTEIDHLGLMLPMYRITQHAQVGLNRRRNYWGIIAGCSPLNSAG